MDKTINELTSQRERLDSLKTAIGKLPRSRGTALSFTALELGRMYIGEVCIELGKGYPYEATKKATSAEGIQAAVDVATAKTPSFSVKGNEIVNINKLRELLDIELSNLTESIRSIKAPKGHIEAFEMSCVCSQAYRGLKESRMWLGIRLGEIRDLEIAKK